MWAWMTGLGLGHFASNGGVCEGMMLGLRFWIMAMLWMWVICRTAANLLRSSMVTAQFARQWEEVRYSIYCLSIFSTPADSCNRTESALGLYQEISERAAEGRCIHRISNHPLQLENGCHLHDNIL